MWVRGLKLQRLQTLRVACYVAPYVGAWIETDKSYTLLNAFQVAPYVGAWIETNITAIFKQMDDVAPYVGAWIETCSLFVTFGRVESHPMWVRGLKQY